MYAITKSGRRYWSRRNTLGQFISRRGFNRSQLPAQHEAWHAYLEARRAAADEATKGHLLTSAGWARGVSVARMFLPGASLKSASEELCDWFLSNGPTLSRRDFIAGWDGDELEPYEAAS